MSLSAIKLKFSLLIGIFILLTFTPNNSNAQTDCRFGRYGEEVGCQYGEVIRICGDRTECIPDPGAVCPFIVSTNPATSSPECVIGGNPGYWYEFNWIEYNAWQTSDPEKYQACTEYINSNGGFVSIWFLDYANKCVDPGTDLNQNGILDSTESPQDGDGAGDEGETSGLESSAGGNICTRGIVPCGPGKEREFCTLCDFFVLLNNLINFILFCLVPPLAVLGIVTGGLIIMISAGNPELVSKAKRILKGAVIGLAVAYGAWLIVNSFLVVVGYKDASNWFVLNLNC